MVRVKTITVSDGDVEIKVTARVETFDNCLGYAEVKKLSNALTSSVMHAIPTLPFVGVYLSQIKVK